MKFQSCFCYLFIIGLVSFAVGRMLPKSWFHEQGFPYRPMKWEKNGNIYRKLSIHKWQNKVPDMSKILPKFMPKKSLLHFRGDPEELMLLAKECCIAECIHALLALLGFYCIKIWPEIGGCVMACLYFLINICYVMIQRYNRPHILKVYDKLIQRGKYNSVTIQNEDLTISAKCTEEIKLIERRGLNYEKH